MAKLLSPNGGEVVLYCRNIVRADRCRRIKIGPTFISKVLNSQHRGVASDLEVYKVACEVVHLFATQEARTILEVRKIQLVIHHANVMLTETLRSSKV